MFRYPDQLLKLNNLALTIPSWLTSLYISPSSPREFIVDTLADLTDPTISHFVHNSTRSIELQPLLPAILLGIGFLNEHKAFEWALADTEQAAQILTTFTSTQLDEVKASQQSKLKEGSRMVLLYAIFGSRTVPDHVQAICSHELRGQVGIYKT